VGVVQGYFGILLWLLMGALLGVFVDSMVALAAQPKL
jgi:hypothetical protein